MGLDDIEFGLNMKTASFLLVGIVVGAAVTFLGMNMNVQSGEVAAENLVSVLESQSGQNLEVVSVERQNGMHRVDVRDQENQLSTYYITEDGSSFTQALTNITNLRTAVESRNSFRQCLADRGVALYGNLSQQPTQAQIQLLGGTQAVAPIYQDVNNNQTLSEAAERGVQQVPSFYYNGSTLPGVNQLNQVEQFTGCSYSLGQN